MDDICVFSSSFNEHILESTGRLARWALFLSNYQIDIIHRKGNLDTNVDVLTRPVFLVPPQIDASKSIEPDSTD
jgi:hypothetical protein